MNMFFSKHITSGVAVACLAGAFLAAAGPADARPMSCTAKFNGCSQRCAAAAGGQGDWMPCIQRTCNRQYDNCSGGGRAGRRGFVANLKQPGPIASGPQTPREPNKTGPFNPGNQGPFGRTGPFVPGGMKPNGGIVSGSMPKNGGIVLSGPTRMSSQGRR